MSRNRFVHPQSVRLYLVDVHRREHAELLKKVAEYKPADGSRVDVTDLRAKPTPEEIAESEARVKAAEDDGAFIDVKRELNAGETRRVFSRLVKDMTAGEKISLEPDKIGLTKLVEYLIGWSFVDEDGQPVPVSEDAINALDQATYREITKAIDAHEAEMDAARRKNTNGETLQSVAISPSVV